MFQFIHTYLEEAWEGLLSSGLFRSGDGLKVMNKPTYTPDRQFNVRCAEDSKLFAILKEERCPFYIDRLQGGIGLPYHYAYDPALLRRMRELLGDDFWGFQMHEWSSNYRNESERVRSAVNAFRKEHPDAPLSAFWSDIKEKVKKDPMALFTEAFSPDEWEHMLYPETVSDFLCGVRSMWAERLQMFGMPLFPADSYHMAHRISIAGGAKRLMPEIGWQIADQRIQIAYAKGMAKAAGIPFGVYHECWCAQDRKNLTIPYSADTWKNEWFEDDLLETVRKHTDGHPENGGSSRSLQERSWINACFQGASAIGEEYGVCNTFTDYRDFALSEYGQVKKKFLTFTETFPDLGTPFTPFAIVLPAEMEILTLDDADDAYLRYPLSSLEPSFAEKIRNARKVLKTLLTDADGGHERLGNEAHVLQNGRYPAVFDILHGDMTDALSGYPYLIDATGDGYFAKRCADKIVPLEKVAALLPEVLPVTVTGGLYYAVNRTATGWMLLIMNNNGVERDKNGERQIAEAALQGEVLPGSLKDWKLSKAAGSGTLSEDAGRWRVSLGAGEWLLLRIG